MTPYFQPPPPVRKRGGFIAGMILLGLGVLCLLLAVAVVVVISVAVSNASSDGDRQMYAFFYTVAVLPFGLAVLFFIAGGIVLIVHAATRR